MSEAEEDDWIEIPRRGTNGKVRADAMVGIVEPGQRTAKGRIMRAMAWVSLRGEALAWAQAQTRFRAAVGGKRRNRLRIAADPGGPIELWMRLTVGTLNLGLVPGWPDLEGREATAADWTIAGNALVLTLPEDWAEPREAEP